MPVQCMNLNDTYIKLERGSTNSMECEFTSNTFLCKKIINLLVLLHYEVSSNKTFNEMSYVKIWYRTRGYGNIQKEYPVYG